MKSSAQQEGQGVFYCLGQALSGPGEAVGQGADQVAPPGQDSNGLVGKHPKQRRTQDASGNQFDA